MTPQQFITKWKRVTLSERSACQQMAHEILRSSELRKLADGITVR